MTMKTVLRAALLAGAPILLPVAAAAQPADADQANADTAAAPADAAPAPAAAGRTVTDPIVITGSQIRGAKIDAVLPVTRVDEAQIEAISPDSGDELFRSIPQAGAVSFNDQNTTGGVNSARGDVASINLRALGTGNTLLLINGRRMVLNPGFQTELLVPVVSPDTNTIPVGGVERIEVLRDGASAVYGADAVAGVVNTILDGNMDGGFLRGTWRASDGTSLYSVNVNGGFGMDFNEGRTNVTIYGNYFHENGAPTSIRDYSSNSDRRRFVEGTDFEGDTQFDGRSTNSPFGSFAFLGQDDDATALGDNNFHIQPATSPGCLIDLGNGLCADNARSIDRDLRYNIDGDRDLFSEKDRYNIYGLFSHEFTPDMEFYGEASYYRTESTRRNVQSAPLGAVPVGISANAYYNPFGPETLADGTPNPNRIAGTDLPAEGSDLLLERYRVIDAGPRVTTVTKDTYRLLAGLRGYAAGFDYDMGLLYSQANSNDLTRNRISTSLFQEAINRTDATAYNPFNGGCFDNPNNGDCTPSNAATIDDFRIDVFRKGETTLALADFKLSKADLLTLPGGDLGIATGVEFRRETFDDDRDPRLDGTITFTDSVTGDFFGSDVLNSSPSPDTSGNREVYSAFAEALIPVVSEDMGIPLMRSFNVQLAGRFEHFSDVGSTFVPRAAASWDVFDGLMLRGAYSQGFRAPNLVQVNDRGTTRANTRDDYVRCQALVANGTVIDLGDCPGTSTVSNRTGTDELQPEDTENINLGVVLTPQFLPGLTLTADYWRIEQKGIVGVFGDDNAIALDLLRRLNGETNPNVIREDPTADDVALFEGTGLAPAGQIIQVLDPYQNLDSRVAKGWDFGLFYDVGDVGIGSLDIALNAARLNSFFQTPSADGQELIDAVNAGVLPDEIVISDIGELLRLNGRPRWRLTGTVNVKSGPVRWNLFARYVDSVFDTSVTQDSDGPDPGAFFPVDDWLTINTSISYTIDNETPLDGVRLKFGINNLFNEDPPLADQSFGFDGSLHSARGRQFLVSLGKTF